MKALVTYYSDSGNTAKVAEGLFKGLKVKNKALVSIEKVTSLKEYDIIYCGFPVIEHSVPMKVQTFLKTIPANSNIAFFSTHGSVRDGAKARTAFETAGTLVKSSRILGTFGVRGGVKQSVIDALQNKPEHKPWIDEAISAAGHPNESDLNDVAQFANQVLDKVKYKTA